MTRALTRFRPLAIGACGVLLLTVGWLLGLAG